VSSSYVPSCASTSKASSLRPETPSLSPATELVVAVVEVVEAVVVGVVVVKSSDAAGGVLPSDATVTGVVVVVEPPTITRNEALCAVELTPCHTMDTYVCRT
jgi:hypothetical protein